MQSRLSRENSIDETVSPVECTTVEKKTQYKLGKLLGVGKSAHVYLCEEVQTGWLGAIKEIFKNTLVFSTSTAALKYRISRFVQLYNPKITNILSFFETEEKLCLITEFCFKTVYEQLKEEKTIGL